MEKRYDLCDVIAYIGEYSKGIDAGDYKTIKYLLEKYLDKQLSDTEVILGVDFYKFKYGKLNADEFESFVDWEYWNKKIE